MKASLVLNFICLVIIGALFYWLIITKIEVVEKQLECYEEIEILKRKNLDIKDSFQREIQTIKLFGYGNWAKINKVK